MQVSTRHDAYSDSDSAQLEPLNGPLKNAEMGRRDTAFMKETKPASFTIL
jgi:hypothetical protein